MVWHLKSPRFSSDKFHTSAFNSAVTKSWWNTFTQCCTSQEHSRIAGEKFDTDFVITSFGTWAMFVTTCKARQFWVTSAKSMIVPRNWCSQKSLPWKEEPAVPPPNLPRFHPARGVPFELWDRYWKRPYIYIYISICIYIYTSTSKNATTTILPIIHWYKVQCLQWSIFASQWLWESEFLNRSATVLLVLQRQIASGIFWKDILSW